MFKILIIAFILIVIFSFTHLSKINSVALYTEADSIVCMLNRTDQKGNCEITIRNKRNSAIIFDTLFQNGIMVKCKINGINIIANHFGNSTEDRNDFHEQSNEFILQSNQSVTFLRQVEISKDEYIHFSFFCCELDGLDLSSGRFDECFNFEMANFDYDNCD